MATLLVSEVETSMLSEGVVEKVKTELSIADVSEFAIEYCIAPQRVSDTEEANEAMAIESVAVLIW